MKDFSSKVFGKKHFDFRFSKFTFLVYSFWDCLKDRGHDAMKGPRNKYKIFIVSEMVKIFRHDEYNYWKHIQNTYFQHSLVGIFKPCQKLIFQRKNSHRSKQKAAKGKQIEKNPELVFYHSK